MQVKADLSETAEALGVAKINKFVAFLKLKNPLASSAMPKGMEDHGGQLKWMSTIEKVGLSLRGTFKNVIILMFACTTNTFKNYVLCTIFPSLHTSSHRG